MYTIVLTDGTTLENLELNGNNFISEKIIEDSVFDDNLDTVTISNGDVVESYNNMVLISNRVDGGKSWFILGERTPQELHDMKIEAKIQYLAMMCGVDLEV